MRRVSDEERRARLARRHGLAAAHRFDDPVAATRAMSVLHATEPATVHLSLFARVEGLTVADVDRALYDDRSLVKQLAMRRTLFVFPRDLLPATWGSASARVADQQQALVTKDVVKHEVAPDGPAWVAAACEAVLDRLAHGDALSAQALREQLPALEGRTRIIPGTSYTASVPMAPRVLTLLGARARIVRGPNAGHWRISKNQWTLMEHWLGQAPAPAPEAEGWAELVRRHLATFGPVTEADLVWWLGATKGIVRTALADVGAVEVALGDGAAAYLLADDLDEEPPVGPWAALLPVLDPTVMGWKERGFYLTHPELTDRNGNIGTTAWWDGRVVGCWVQDDLGVVHVHPLERVPAAGRRALAAEAARLTDWLAGVRIGTVYSSPAMKAAREARG